MGIYVYDFRFEFSSRMQLSQGEPEINYIHTFNVLFLSQKCKSKVFFEKYIYTTQKVLRILNILNFLCSSYMLCVHV